MSPVHRVKRLCELSLSRLRPFGSSGGWHNHCDPPKWCILPVNIYFMYLSEISVTLPKPLSLRISQSSMHRLFSDFQIRISQLPHHNTAHTCVSCRDGKDKRKKLHQQAVFNKRFVPQSKAPNTSWLVGATFPKTMNLNLKVSWECQLGGRKEGKRNRTDTCANRNRCENNNGHFCVWMSRRHQHPRFGFKRRCLPEISATDRNPMIRPIYRICARLSTVLLSFCCSQPAFHVSQFTLSFKLKWLLNQVHFKERMWFKGKPSEH